MPKRLDPELVHSLYLNCKKDQRQGVPCDPPLGDAAPAELRALLVDPLKLSIESIGFEARADHQRRAEIVWQLVQDSRSIESVLRREDPTNARQKLFGNSREIPDLLRLRQLLI
uniref:Uncharacterized protein n=1 Tax=Oryza nivara TaxID=4536 RepID=A0A0E0FI09_ORYNI